MPGDRPLMASVRNRRERDTADDGARRECEHELQRRTEVVVCHLAMLEISDDDEWPEPVSDEEYITANQQQ
jgi:hypothetical protein